MMNEITILQNDRKQIIRLAAQRALYSKAKILFGIRTSIAILIAITGAVFASVCPEWRPLVALVALPFAFLDGLYLDALQKRWTSTAAKIQEMFDTDVLGQRWVEIRYGRPVDEEEVIEIGSEIADKPDTETRLKDWYPTSVERIPLHLGRLVCQRANCVWDRKLRLRYTEAVLGILILVSLIVFVIGLRVERSFEQFILSVVVPLSPGVLLGLRHLNGLRESNKTLEKLSSDVEKAWRQALANPTDGAAATEAARDIQSQLFDHRKNGQVLFDWLYWLLRSKSENAMQIHSDDLVRDAERALR